MRFLLACLASALVACSSHDDTAPSDGGACCYFGDSIAWGIVGGIAPIHPRSQLTSCRRYSRSNPQIGQDPAIACEQDVLDCAANDIAVAKNRSDVAAALALGQVVYGRNSVPVDGTAFTFTVANANVTVGEDCAGAANCTPIPAGVAALVALLQNLETRELARGDCREKFPPPAP